MSNWKKIASTHPAYPQFLDLLAEGDPVHDDLAEQFWVFFHEGWHSRGGVGRCDSAFDKQIGGDHYKDFPIQPMVFSQLNHLGFCEGTAVKYIVRHPFKGGREDVEKAIDVLHKLIELDYPVPTAELED